MSDPHKQNIATTERVLRVVIGAALSVFGVVVFVGGPAFWGFVGAALAVAAGVDLVITGARGYCPLYARLGHVPKSLSGTVR